MLWVLFRGSLFGEGAVLVPGRCEASVVVRLLSVCRILPADGGNLLTRDDEKFDGLESRSEFKADGDFICKFESVRRCCNGRGANSIRRC